MGEVVATEIMEEIMDTIEDLAEEEGTEIMEGIATSNSHNTWNKNLKNLLQVQTSCSFNFEDHKALP